MQSGGCHVGPALGFLCAASAALIDQGNTVRCASTSCGGGGGGGGDSVDAGKSEWRRFAVEMGTGTSLRRQDHTAAAVRALQDALWRISLTAYRALGKQPQEMRVEIVIGVPNPDAVDRERVLAILPYVRTLHADVF
eukprot:SAG31_NODE_3605_length_4077_cov_12.386124_1_plen_137_part_00